MKVLYTNMASSVESWLVKAEGVLDASARKIVGLDVEYDKSRDSYFRKKKAAVIQLCYGENVLVYHIYHADEKCPKLRDFLWGWRYIFAGFCIAEDKNVLGRADLPVHNLKDIQQIWRDPEKSWKRTQGLKDVAAAIIDPYYEEMKDGFGNTEHSMWANASPLPDKHLEYAARDAYATYEVYRRFGFFVMDSSSKSPRPQVPEGAPSIDEAAAPNSQEDSLPEGAPSIDEAAAPNSQEVSLPVDASYVEDAPSIADASLFVEPAGDTLDDMVASVDNTVTDVLTSIKENFGASGGDDVDNEDDPLSSSELSVTPSQSVDGTEPVTQLCDVPAQLIAEQEKVAGKKLRAYERRKVKDSSRAPVLGGFVAAQKELRSRSVHDTHAPVPNSDVAPANELRSKRVHDPVDDVGDMSNESTAEKEIRSKTVHDPVDDMSDESTPEKEIRSKTVHDPVDHISLLVRAKERRFIKRKLVWMVTASKTESDNVGDGKEDTEGGKDDLNDAEEDLQDGTGGDDAFVEHGAAPLAESPLVSPDSQIVPFEPVEKSFATPDVPSAAVEREYVEFDPDIFTSQRWNADISSQEDAAVRDAVIKCDPINISSQDDPAVKNAVNKSDVDLLISERSNCLH
ncbi:hypothetical protein ACQ4PT_061788 [Festuca glaucescens]